MKFFPPLEFFLKLRILYVPLEVKKNYESNNPSISEMPLLNELHLGARHKTHSGFLPTNRQPPRYTSHDDLRNLPAVSEQSSDFFTSKIRICKLIIVRLPLLPHAIILINFLHTIIPL